MARMTRTVVISVDTSPAEPGIFGILGIVQDSVESYDTSSRSKVFNLVYEAVERVCHIVAAGFDKGRAFFGMWATTFIIPTAEHNEENRQRLLAELKTVYEANQDQVRGFRLIWEGDRQRAMGEEVEASMERFGHAGFNLGPRFFSHLRDNEKDK